MIQNILEVMILEGIKKAPDSKIKRFLRYGRDSNPRPPA